MISISSSGSNMIGTGTSSCSGFASSLGVYSSAAVYAGFVSSLKVSLSSSVMPPVAFLREKWG